MAVRDGFIVERHVVLILGHELAEALFQRQITLLFSFLADSCAFCGLGSFHLVLVLSTVCQVYVESERLPS